MTDQRVGRHIRIYEWDEVDIEEETPQAQPETKTAKAVQADKKAAEQPKGLGGLLKRKLF